MSDDTARWVATLSDGTTAAEHSGEFQLIPGQRTPWVRLTEYLGQNKLHLSSLRLNYKGRTIHLPRANFDRFTLNDVSRAPLFYSLCYHVEGEMPWDGGELIQTKFIELAAHYDSFVVSYIQDIDHGANSWVVVTDERTVLAETPRSE